MNTTVLIIDDNHDDHQFYRRVLKESQYTLKSAFTGEEGLAMALELTPALIVLDYMLPEMNGLEFVKKLQEQLPNIPPILMLTGEGSEPVAVEALTIGVQDYVVKDHSGGFLTLLPSRIDQVLRTHKERVASTKLKALHETILQSVADGVLGFDHEGTLVFANQSALGMLGGESQDIIGSNIEKFLLPTGQAMSWESQPLTRLAPEQSTYSCDSCLLQSIGGELFPINYTASRTPSGDPEFSGWVLVFQDSTQRKKAEAELRIAATTFEASEAIMVTDADANIIRVNQAYSLVTGYAPKEVIGKNPRFAQSKRHGVAFYEDMWGQLLDMGTWSGEIWDKRKNGELYPKWITITAVKNEQGETTQYVAIFRDITQQKIYEEKIRSMAYYDTLTKLPNRRLFLDRFQTALLHAERNKEYGAVLFIDLDRFKELNDTQGHDCGDLLLIEVGVRISACLRKLDTVARFGGDEFVVLLSGVNKERQGALENVSKVAEKIRASLTNPYILNGHEHTSSPSIGGKLFCAEHESMETLLKLADQTMYDVKKAGRNGVSIYKDEPKEG